MDWILSFFVSLDDQIARISRMKASIFFVIRARSGPRFCSRQIPLKNVTIKPCARLTQGGSHSATGEEWADDDNAATAAEAQSFKRACSCFGLGRYLYYFTGTWVDLDERKRPKSVPRLDGWATPEGWRRGLRPHAEGNSKPAERTTARTDGRGDGHRNGNDA